jgi:hypothetical protein
MHPDPCTANSQHDPDRAERCRLGDRHRDQRGQREPAQARHPQLRTPQVGTAHEHRGQHPDREQGELNGGDNDDRTHQLPLMQGAREQRRETSLDLETGRRGALL